MVVGRRHCARFGRNFNARLPLSLGHQIDCRQFPAKTRERETNNHGLPVSGGRSRRRRRRARLLGLTFALSGWPLKRSDQSNLFVATTCSRAASSWRKQTHRRPNHGQTRAQIDHVGCSNSLRQLTCLSVWPPPPPPHVSLSSHL